MEKLKRIDIENKHGNCIFSFYISKNSKISGFSNCNIADVEVENDVEVVRIQQEE